MSNVLIINAHHYYPFSEGRLNSSLVERAAAHLSNKGYNIRIVTMKDDHNVDEQLSLHQWADIILLQSPINWMGVPWSFKKYMDKVYTAGMGGALCNGDGRNAEEPKKNYGTGGTLKGKKYMMSVTFNAPAESFNDKDEYLFEGKSVDDLLFPMHANFRFFGLEALPTFAAFDVMKNADVENDFLRFEAHIAEHF
ncbi:NAD(P)H-dependent oxidoreductase [Alteromonas gracilis]|uniref:NAD(P)H-dependent oxidoreductase n=1 Tax=Alteromonas gracilis TaxID=1479524 RepID=UPI003736D283